MVSSSTAPTVPLPRSGTSLTIGNSFDFREVLIIDYVRRKLFAHFGRRPRSVLLEMWMKGVRKAPGRTVSSPWPDRIEITTLAKEGSDRYEVTGFVVEVTSVEVANGGAAAKIPIRMVIQKDQGGWLITEYAEEQ